MNAPILYKGERYPFFQSEGNAAQFAIPYAKYFCQGIGIDVGCKKVEWSFPGSIPVDPCLNKYDALNFPDGNFDYVFSSHCLEHLISYVDALDYWISKLKSGGTLFLYLPHESQKYWRPWNNRKHFHLFNQNLLKMYFEEHGEIDQESIFVSERDLNHSFMVTANKI